MTTEQTYFDESAGAPGPGYLSLDTHDLPYLQGDGVSFGVADDLADLDLGMHEALTADEELGPGDLQLVKMPKSDVWRLSDGEIYESLTGVILARTKSRAWWSPDAAEDNSPPTCVSEDAVTGRPVNAIEAADYNIPMGADGTAKCAECPLAQWGSAIDDAGNPQRGQACRLNTMLLFAVEGLRAPLVLRLPPTSAGPMREYCVSLQRDRGLPYWGVKTRLGLRIQESGKNEWTIIVPQYVDRFDRTSIIKLKEARSEMRALVERGNQLAIADTSSE